MITKKVQTELCFGCGSCAAVCPVKAINMVRDKYGFLRPQVDEKICVNCNQCVEHCPVLTRKIQRAPVKKAVVVRADGAENSASGGAFFNLAKSLLTKPECFFQTTQKIFIAGTIWNEDFLPETVLTNDLATVEKMRGSKYVWGSTGNSYTETAAALKAGHMVFYSGTPCQIAGLYAFLGEDPDNLITLEILCHGGGAPIVWQSYLEFAGRKYGKRPAECKMQNAKGKIIFTFADGTHKIEDINKENEYVPLYMQGKTKRDCCLVCPFMGRVRNADIIVGDVWAKWAAKERNKGISLFIVNSPKAEMLLKHTHWQMMHHFDLDSRCNSPLNKINGNIPAIAPDREEILERFAAELPFEQAIKNKKVGLMNFNYPRDNYGALLLAFAMEKVVRDLGYEPYTINYYKNPITMNFDPQSAMWKFREKYLTLSGFAVEKRDLKQFNNMFEKFIFGSDVIWKDTREYVYFADWIKGKKTLIAYGASFCENQQPAPDWYKRGCMRRFDAVSVREKSGIDICRDYAGIDATHVIDPSLLLHPKDYQCIIDDGKVEIPCGKYAVYYTFWKFNPYDVCLDMPLYNAFKDGSNHSRSFAQWLALIQNAALVITSSFHGICFSLLYNRPFVYLAKPGEDNERAKSLLTKFGLDERLIVCSEKEIADAVAHMQINWSEVNKKIDAFRIFSLNWLKNALEIAPNNKRKMKRNMQIVKFRNFLARIISCFIFNKQKRRKFRNQYK